MAETGTLYVVAAPSGAGKTSLVNELIASLTNITVSISHTTRPKRPAEQDGINYYFVDKNAFNRMLMQGDFIEHAQVFDHDYGTSKHFLLETLARNKDVILEIDWQGYQQVKRLFATCVGIFILPPSFADLKNRLVSRNQDKEEIIKKRLADVKETVSHINEFDYIVVNDHFDQALNDLQSIITTNRLKREKQLVKFAGLIAEFLK